MALLRTIVVLLLAASVSAADLSRDVRKAFRVKEPASRAVAIRSLVFDATMDRKARNKGAAAIEKALKQETHPTPRIAALELLYRLGTDRALDRLLVGIVDRNEPVREWVRGLVRDRPDPRLHDAVIRTMREDSSWKFRAMMVDLLLEARWSTTRRALVDALSDEHPAVQARAAEALERLTGAAYGVDKDKWLAHFRKEADAAHKEHGRTYAAKPEKIEIKSGPITGLVPTLYTIPIRDKNIVFVVDMSSSMHKTSRSSHFVELRQAIFRLPSDVSFNILCFDQRLFFFAKARELVPATTTNKAAAERWLQDLPAGQRTDVFQSIVTGLAMIKEALVKNPKGRAELFVLSDGRETVKTTSLDRVEAMYQKLPAARCRVHFIALGRGGTPLLRALAVRSGGQFAEAGQQ